MLGTSMPEQGSPSRAGLCLCWLMLTGSSNMGPKKVSWHLENAGTYFAFCTDEAVGGAVVTRPELSLQAKHELCS